MTGKNSKYVANVFSTTITERLKESGQTKVKLILTGTCWPKGIVKAFIKEAMLQVENLEHEYIIYEDLKLHMDNNKMFDEF